MRFVLLFLSVATLIACTPAVNDTDAGQTDTRDENVQNPDVREPDVQNPDNQEPEDIPMSEAAQAAQATAEEAFHLMELAKLRSGEYSPNALAELELPRGVLWTIESFGAESYVLNVTSQEAPDTWRVSETGVERLTSANEDGG